MNLRKKRIEWCCLLEPGSGNIYGDVIQKAQNFRQMEEVQGIYFYTMVTIVNNNTLYNWKLSISSILTMKNMWGNAHVK